MERKTTVRQLFAERPIIAYILAWTDKNWSLTFYVSAGSYFVAAICWMLINPARPDVEEPDKFIKA